MDVHKFVFTKCFLDYFLVTALTKNNKQCPHSLTCPLIFSNHVVTSVVSYLQVKVADINDNAPILTSPKVLSLPALNFNEPSNAEVSFNLKLKDLDDWEVGNGPPFSVTIDPNTELGITTFLKMKHKPGLFVVLTHYVFNFINLYK